MDIELNTQEDTKMEDGYFRYMRLHAIVEEINSRPLSQTSEWYAQHYLLLKMYREHFTDFSCINDEIDDKDFRLRCLSLEITLCKLITEYESRGWFSVYDYLQFNVNAIWVVDYTNDIDNIMTDEGEDLQSLFTNMAV
jgi:hypothetical protein